MRMILCLGRDATRYFSFGEWRGSGGGSVASCLFGKTHLAHLNSHHELPPRTRLLHDHHTDSKLCMYVYVVCLHNSSFACVLADRLVVWEQCVVFLFAVCCCIFILVSGSSDRLPSDAGTGRTVSGDGSHDRHAGHEDRRNVPNAQAIIAPRDFSESKTCTTSVN